MNGSDMSTNTGSWVGTPSATENGICVLREDHWSANYGDDYAEYYNAEVCAPQKNEANCIARDDVCTWSTRGMFCWRATRVNPPPSRTFLYLCLSLCLSLSLCVC
jgi:hypothetical protein